MAKSLTEKAYDKERRRIQNFMRRAEKRGYRFSDSVIPKKPKKITAASVKRLKNITPTKLYKESRFIDPESGVELAGVVARDYERSAAGRKAAATRKAKAEKAKQRTLPPEFDDDQYIIDNFTQEIEHAYSVAGSYEGYRKRSQNFQNKFQQHSGMIRQILLSTLSTALSTRGKDAVAKSIQDNAETLSHEILIASMDYRDESWQPSVQKITEILLDKNLTIQESINLDSITQEEWGV